MLGILRMVAAFLYVPHGTQKLFAWPPAQSSAAPVKLATERGLAGLLETFGGGLIFVGLFTRPVAFVLAGEMAVAYFQVHAPRGLLPISNGGDNAALFCFIFLF